MVHQVQPFAYQQSSHSCWIVSMHNALIALFGESYKVPHDMSKLFYEHSSDDGVSTRDMESILKIVRQRNRLKIHSFKKGVVTKSIIRRYLEKDNTVMVCDVNSGNHSLLATNIRGDEMVAFDPDWGSVASGEKFENRYQCCPYGDSRKGYLNPHHNVSIKVDHLLKDPVRKKDKFVMGDISRRHAAFISKI